MRESVTSIIDENGQMAKGYQYNDYGVTKETGSSNVKNSVKYTGAVEDKATGLYYMMARHYNPQSGRFVQQDTYKGELDTLLSQNQYTYTWNNPVNMIDPTGHYWVAVSSTKTEKFSRVGYSAKVVRGISTVNGYVKFSVDSFSAGGYTASDLYDVPASQFHQIKSMSRRYTTINVDPKKFVKMANEASSYWGGYLGSPNAVSSAAYFISIINSRNDCKASAWVNTYYGTRKSITTSNLETKKER